MGENHFERLPTAIYGVILLLAGFSYSILQNKLVHHGEGENALLGEAVGRHPKGKLWLGFYLLAIGLVFVNQHISQVIYIVVAIMWFIPDRRIEKAMDE